MRQFNRIGPIIAALALAACSREPAMDAQMKADLEAVSSGGIELAPAGGGTKTVSAIEQVQKAQPRQSAPKPQAPPSAPRVAQNAPDPDPTPQRTPQPVSNEPVARVPASRPAVQPPPPGGYKSVGEVIRNAPFPIKPATKVP
jgi:hypothetical protein